MLGKQQQDWAMKREQTLAEHKKLMEQTKKEKKAAGESKKAMKRQRRKERRAAKGNKEDGGESLSDHEAGKKGDSTSGKRQSLPVTAMMVPLGGGELHLNSLFTSDGLQQHNKEDIGSAPPSPNGHCDATEGSSVSSMELALLGKRLSVRVCLCACWVENV